MYGRYGTDKLNSALGIFWLIVSIVNALFFGSLIIRLSMTALFGVILFRSLSRNILKRQEENERFLRFCRRISPHTQKIRSFFHKVKRWENLQIRKFKDRKTHRYIRCPYCKAIIRVPLRKGRHTVRCPKCREDIKTNIRF